MVNMLSTITGEGLDGNSMVALLLASIAGTLLLSGIRRRQRDRAARTAVVPGLRKPIDEPSTDSKEKLRRDLEMLLGELQDLSRRIGAEIDTRFAKLEAALRDADRRIAVLTRLSRPGDQPAPAEHAGESQDQDVRYAVVYELADAGFSAVQIAKDLGKTPGEVELILNLRRAAQKS